MRPSRPPAIDPCNAGHLYAARAGLAVLFAATSGAPAQGQSPLLVEPHRYLPSVANSVSAVVAGDIDLDGDIDLAVGTTSVERIYWNDGGGRLQLGRMASLGAGDSTQAVVLFDVDGDGDLDLVSGNGLIDSRYGGQRNRLYLNVGGGNFLDATNQLPAISDVTSSLAFGDVDGDKDLDLLIGNSGDEDSFCERNELWLNNGAGVFVDATWRLPLFCDTTRAVALCDVDGDGDLDALIGNEFLSNRLLLNDGTGLFAEAGLGIPTSGIDPTFALALGDVDGDGDRDVVLGTRAQERLFLNDGAGFFTDATGQLPPDSEITRAVALRDIDSDGDLDLLAGNLAQDRLYLNDGAGVFFDATASKLPVQGQTSALALADFDLDGDLDAVFASKMSGGTHLELNEGTGALSDVPSQLPKIAPSVCYAIAIGDVNGDLRPDALLGMDFGANILLLNLGGGTFVDGSSQLPAHTDDTQSVALGDVDGDGDLDALIGNGGLFSSSQQQNRLYLNDGAGMFSDATTQLPVILDNTREVVFGDVDRDGDLDALVGNYNQPAFLLSNNGLGVFSVAVGAIPSATLRTDAVALGDLDNDGDLDAVLGIFFGQNQLWLNDGTGTFVDASLQLPSDADQSWSLALGDVDADGDLDILLGNRVQTPPQHVAHRLYLNDGLAHFSDATAQLPTFSPGVATTEVSLGDLDDDGDLDALLGTYGQDRLFLNDGLGNFSDATERIPVDIDATFAIGLADLDQDGDLDAVLGSLGAPVRFLSNLSRHLAWRHVPAIGKHLILDLNGPSGGAFTLHASTQEALAPIPPYGILQIRRQDIFTSQAGAFDSLGRASVTRAIPSQPALLGTTWYWQALVQPPRRLTNLERTTITGL